MELKCLDLLVYLSICHRADSVIVPTATDSESESRRCFYQAEAQSGCRLYVPTLRISRGPAAETRHPLSRSAICSRPPCVVGESPVPSLCSGDLGLKRFEVGFKEKQITAVNVLWFLFSFLVGILLFQLLLDI